MAKLHRPVGNGEISLQRHGKHGQRYALPLEQLEQAPDANPAMKYSTFGPARRAQLVYDRVILFMRRR